MMLHLLTIVLVILKALGYIAFSWWLVFAPSLFATALALVLIGGAAWILKADK